MDQRIASRRKRSKQARLGATVVEAAFVLPVFFVLVYGVVEYCHAQMISNLLQAGTRNAARYGATEGVTTGQCIAKANEIIDSGTDASAVTVIVKNAGMFDSGGALPSSPSDFEGLADMNLTEAEPRQIFLVRASVPYSEVSLLPVPWFFGGVNLTGQAVARHE